MGQCFLCGRDAGTPVRVWPCVCVVLVEGKVTVQCCFRIRQSVRLVSCHRVQGLRSVHVGVDAAMQWNVSRLNQNAGWTR